MKKSIKLAADKIIDFFSTLDIEVNLYETQGLIEGYELNTYTDLGFNICPLIDFRDTFLNPHNLDNVKKACIDYFTDFDVESEVMSHYQSSNTNNHPPFTIKQSIADFEKYKAEMLEKFSEKTEINKEDKLTELVIRMVEESQESILKNLQKVVDSGNIDLTNWDPNNNSMILVKAVYTALLKEELFQYDLSKMTAFKKEFNSFVKQASNAI